MTWKEVTLGTILGNLKVTEIEDNTYCKIFTFEAVSGDFWTFRIVYEAAFDDLAEMSVSEPEEELQLDFFEKI